MKEQIICKMIRFYKGNTHDIEHFLKVYTYASMIGKLERIDAVTQEILEIASIVHDIACPLCREKYGSAYGNRQEEESESLLVPFLEEFHLNEDVQKRVIYLVCHHHTYANVDGIDYQILLEADYLVNAAEGSYSKENIEKFCQSVFNTSTGTKLLNNIYLEQEKES